MMLDTRTDRQQVGDAAVQQVPLDLLARLAEVDRRYEEEAAEQDGRLAECLELVRRTPGGRA